jgi:hypothetical protein
MGRPYGGTPVCEAHPSIDVRAWPRQGLLSAGNSFPYSLSQYGEPCGSINVRTLPSAVVLSFHARNWDSDEWRPVTQHVPIAWTVCHFGGHRRWFCCTAYSNGQHCGRRVAKLYLGGSGIFACRRCYCLTYASQLERVGLRGLGKARKIRMKMGGGPNIFDDFPPKPKGMHWRTYARLRRVYEVTFARL